MTSAPRPRHVLLINDQPEFLWQLAAVLADEDYRVTALRLPPPDLATLQQTHPDVIVLDIPARRDEAVLTFLRTLAPDPSVVSLPLVVTFPLQVDTLLATAGIPDRMMTVVFSPYRLDTLVTAIETTLAA